MSDVGVSPNVVSYTPLLDRLGRAGFLDQAVELFDEMRAQGIQPNVMSYTALIGACRVAGEPERGWVLFSEMTTVP